MVLADCFVSVKGVFIKRVFIKGSSQVVACCDLCIQRRSIRVDVQFHVLILQHLKKLTGHGNEKDQHKGNKVVESHLIVYFSAFSVVL